MVGFDQNPFGFIEFWFDLKLQSNFASIKCTRGVLTIYRQANQYGASKDKPIF